VNARLRAAPFERAIEVGKRGEVGDERPPDRDGQRLRPQALALADRAGRRGHVLHHVLAIALGLRVFEVSRR
jgi:hypothetical protein